MDADEQRRVLRAEAGGERVGARAERADRDRGAAQLQQRERAAADLGGRGDDLAAGGLRDAVGARCWRTCSGTSSMARTGIAWRACAGSR